MQKYLTVFKNAGPAGRIVHFEGAIGVDTALCGADLAGDSNIYEEAPRAMNNGKVNCPHCIAVVRHCKRIKESEMEAN